MYQNFAKKFDGLNELAEWTVHSLSVYFAVPAKCFVQSPTNDILFVRQRYLSHPDTYLLQGTLFFLKERRVVRNLPRLCFGRIYQPQHPVAVQFEDEILSALEHTAFDLEENVPGITVRIIHADNQFYWATDWLWGTGSGLHYQALPNQIHELLEKHAPGAFDLARDGYVPVLKVTAKKFSFLTPPPLQNSALLTDVIHENRFLPGSEKKRLAAKFQLKTPAVIARWEKSFSTRNFRKEIKRLEYICYKQSVAGLVARGTTPETAELFLKIDAQNAATPHLGRPEIPKHQIQQIVNRLAAEMNPADFIDSEIGWPAVLAELTDLFQINPENEIQIYDYYTTVQEQVASDFSAFNRALDLLNTTHFPSKKELAQ
ncbi:hypothetical protein KAH55_14815, partial [bacterium]|nr:hypothetical protein [bacterium]